MRNTWPCDCHVSRWKGVLHLDQKEFGGGRMRKGREKIERREKEKKNGEEMRSSIYWSPVFEQARSSTGQDASWIAL